VVDHALDVPPGEYRLVLDTDELRFGGQGRLTADQRYFTEPVTGGEGEVHRLRFYLPCRTALVMEKM
jgi:1,4-alpha-glucan branching enzyme